MTSSRSKISRSSLVAAIAVLVLAASTALAGGHKRVVVLDFEGPKAEKFHDDVVKILKKSHTVVPLEKWTSTADELDAAKVTEKNVKKVAKKLKIDGVITGKIEKRHDEYVIVLKLRSGASGEVVGNKVETKSDTPRIEGDSQRAIKDELVAAVDDLEANHGGASDDEATADDPPKKKHKDDDAAATDDPPKKKHHKDDDAAAATDDPPKKHHKDDDAAAATDDPPKKHHKDDDAAATSDDPPKKKKHKDDDEASGSGDDPPKKKHKRVAASEDDDGVTKESGDHPDAMDPETAVNPANRAIDLGIGLSFTARKLSFKSDADLAAPPPDYSNQAPLPGAYIDGTVYPLSIGHHRTDALAGLGLTFSYDRVLYIKSEKAYTDATTMMTAVASLATTESRWSVGPIFRYPLNGKGAVGGSVVYSKQTFKIAQQLPDMSPTDVPDVTYQAFEVGGFVQYPVIPKLTADLNVGLMAITNPGDIGSTNQYGGGGKIGFEGALGADYMLKPKIFLRAQIRVEEVSLSFNGTGTQTTNRDSDPAQDVHGATDLYYGGAVTIGFFY